MAMAYANEARTHSLQGCCIQMSTWPVGYHDDTANIGPGSVYLRGTMQYSWYFTTPVSNLDRVLLLISLSVFSFMNFICIMWQLLVL